MAAQRHLEMLVQGGFVHIGEWQANSSGSIVFKGDNSIPREAGVYAYVVDGMAHYIGSAQRGLRSRLRHYEIAKTMRTAHRIRHEILELIVTGHTVDVFVMTPPPLVLNDVLPINTVAGLEEGLIQSLRPCWNRRGMGRI